MSHTLYVVDAFTGGLFRGNPAAVGINEDPVTGSAHCALGPYWEAKLGKPELATRPVPEVASCA